MLEDQKRQVHNLRRHLQDKRRKEIRRDFSRKQAVIEIERQLTGGAVSDEPAREPTTDSLEDEWTRRNKAVAAGIQYCGFQEGGPLRGRWKRSTSSDDDDTVPSPPARKIKPDTPPTTSWENGRTTGREQTFACFQCPKTYSEYNGVKRHFRTSLLTDRTCNFCDLCVLYEMHLRRHAQDVHGLRK
ncbi:Zinc finger C2H2 [Penicillium cosmopolitanum]|uniref:Zinc finger C2H2 n=1 Tax=Penicillium cosmopolitanum TaxID=1131564 RepID=A0A9W9WAU4_9EURO|nr:Zinc finger C2H2 [Penicillium cosmopolitanum]KAJ5414115.1 Zinc finger C2H2 [Penicillium cosmopolitanum]